MTTFSRRQSLIALSWLGASSAWAQADRPVKFILPNATASGVDTITRSAQGALTKALGHPVIVDNQLGAGGVVGVSALVRSAPDGYTLSVVSNNVVIYPSLIKQLPFDPIADVTPIAIVGATPIIVVVNPKLAANNAKELVALLRAKNGQINYGSSGNGNILHVGACRAWGWVRAGASRGANLGVGEAQMGKFGWPTQRADNDKWRPASL